MLNDRQRHTLHELERQLVQEDPAWVRQFSTFTPLERDRSNTALDISLGVAVVLTTLGLVFDHPQIVMTFCGIALILAFVRFHP